MLYTDISIRENLTKKKKKSFPQFLSRLLVKCHMPLRKMWHFNMWLKLLQRSIIFPQEGHSQTLQGEIKNSFQRARWHIVTAGKRQPVRFFVCQKEETNTVFQHEENFNTFRSAAFLKAVGLLLHNGLNTFQSRICNNCSILFCFV